MERKLAAIFSADVKGYSRLMGDDEEATIHTLKSYRDVIARLIEHHHGRVVDSPGDNMLAEFASAVDAVVRLAWPTLTWRARRTRSGRDAGRLSYTQSVRTFSLRPIGLRTWPIFLSCSETRKQHSIHLRSFSLCRLCSICGRSSSIPLRATP